MKNPTQQEWLKVVEDDQPIQDITTIERLKKSFNNMKWFFSHLISPSVQMGYYSPSTEKIVLGGVPMGTPYSQETSSIAAAHAYTVPAGERWIVRSITANDDTTNSVFDLLITPIASGVQVLLTRTNAVTTTVFANLLGNNTTGAASGNGGLGNPIYLSAGDIITINNNSHAGGTVTTDIFYEVI